MFIHVLGEIHLPCSVHSGLFHGKRADNTLALHTSLHICAEQVSLGSWLLQTMPVRLHGQLH